jgi:hypothetical protein
VQACSSISPWFTRANPASIETWRLARLSPRMDGCGAGVRPQGRVRRCAPERRRSGKSYPEGPPKIRIPNNWAPRNYQMNVWRYLERGGKRAICVWHRRAGKDDVCLHWAAASMIDKPATYWHMLPAFSQGRKAIWTAVNPHTGKRRIDEAFPHEPASTPTNRKCLSASRMARLGKWLVPIGTTPRWVAHLLVSRFRSGR